MQELKCEDPKFQIQELLPIGFTLIVLGLGIAYGLDVMTDVQTDLAGNHESQLAVNNTIDAVAEIPDKLDTVIVVIMAAVIIGVLVTYLYQRFAR